MTALHHGVEHGSCVALLLEEDALVDAQDHDGRTPLWYAVSDGYRESAEILLAHGANPHLKDATVCHTPTPAPPPSSPLPSRSFSPRRRGGGGGTW